MNELTWLVIIFGVVVVQRLIELVIAARNERWIKERGGEEYAPEHYKWIVLLHLGWIIAWPLESYLGGPTISSSWSIYAVGLSVAQVLRYGALLSLGRYWNTRIIIVPHARRVTRGLYRVIPHPNYLAVALELALFPALFGAMTTALVVSLLNAALLLGVRIPAENRALALLK